MLLYYLNDPGVLPVRFQKLRVRFQKLRVRVVGGPWVMLLSVIIPVIDNNSEHHQGLGCNRQAAAIGRFFSSLNQWEASIFSVKE